MRNQCPAVCLLALVFWHLPAPELRALEAEEIFERTSPSVVQLTSADSEGSGVIIGETGLILTNLHVAATATPMTVTMLDASGKVTRRVEGAAMYRVHPNEDLAVLRFDPGGFKPVGARIAGTDDEPKPAATCFAISSPAGNEGALTNTITQGIVSTPRRKLDGREYIQFSAAVNPGSSGGALVDRNARLIGLITSKQEGGEGVAFATRLAGLDLKSFVEPSKRAGDKGRYDRAIELAARTRMAGALGMFADPGGGLPEQLAASAYYSKLALTEFPADETAFRGLIEVYYLAGKQDVCLALARSAAKATKSSYFLSIEARSLGLLGKENEALDAYSKALNAEDGKASPMAAGNLALMLAKRDRIDWGQVAYLARWGLVSQSPNNEAAKKELSELFEKAAANLPQTASRAIRAKESGFTVAEMRGFPGKPPPMPKGDAEMMNAFDPAFYQPVLSSSSSALKVPAEMIPELDRGDDSDFVMTMDSRVDAFIPAAGGRVGLLVSTEADTVHIFDVALGNTIGKVQCPKGSLAGKWVIGGLDHWALVDKKQFRIERFQLLKRTSPQIIEPKAGKIPWNAFGAIMSPYRDDLAWILLSEPDGRVTVAIYHFGIGVIRTPDHSGLPVHSLRTWPRHSHPRFKIDPAGMTCAPEGGGEVFLRIEPTTFRLQAIEANYIHRQLAFPFSNRPCDWFLDTISAKTWNQGKMVTKWEAGGDGWMGTPLAMAPVHGSSRVVQLSHGARLMLQIREPDSGECVLPIREIDYNSIQDPFGGKPSDPKRFEIISHRSTPRVAVFDFLANKLVSARMHDWDRLEGRPLVIHRKRGAEVRFPFKTADGSTMSCSEYPGTGIKVDQAKGELVITDAEPDQMKPVMQFMVEVQSAAKIRTLYPFKVVSQEGAPAPP